MRELDNGVHSKISSLLTKYKDKDIYPDLFNDFVIFYIEKGRYPNSEDIKPLLKKYSTNNNLHFVNEPRNQEGNRHFGDVNINKIEDRIVGDGISTYAKDEYNRLFKKYFNKLNEVDKRFVTDFFKETPTKLAKIKNTTYTNIYIHFNKIYYDLFFKISALYPEIVKGTPVYTKINNIRKAYNTSEGVASRILLDFPIFTGYDHTRVLDDIQKYYKIDLESARKKILSFPQFAGYDHSRVLDDIQKYYKVDLEIARKKILSFPQFAGYDHSRVLNDIQKAYMVNIDIARKMVLTFPQFAGLNQVRALNDVCKVYDVNIDVARKKIITNSQFAARNHSKIVRDNIKLGKLFGLDEKTIKQLSIEYNLYSMLSPSKKVAIIDSMKNQGYRIKHIDKTIILDFIEQNNRNPTEKELKIERIKRLLRFANSFNSKDPYVKNQGIKLRESIAKKRGKIIKMRASDFGKVFKTTKLRRA
jgi:hypothetical protein